MAGPASLFAGGRLAGDDDIWTQGKLVRELSYKTTIIATSCKGAFASEAILKKSASRPVGECEMVERSQELFPKPYPCPVFGGPYLDNSPAINRVGFNKL